MRIENITAESLNSIATEDLYALRLRMKQVFMKYQRLEKEEPMVMVDWPALISKQIDLMTELGYRVPHRPISELDIWFAEIQAELVIAKEEVKAGIYLVPPHGKWIWEGKKLLIVKAKQFPGMVDKPLILISGSLAYGVIQLKSPAEIDLDKFFELAMGHLISETERQKWWPGKKQLYAYEFEIISRYDEPRQVEVPQGIQTFIEEVKFKKGSTWELVKPSYRIFEFDDLKNTPGFKTGEAIIEAKFDGVRAKITMTNGTARIMTDPEETRTPDKTKRLPHQIKELEAGNHDNYIMDAEIVMIKDVGSPTTRKEKDDKEALHRTSVNALINSKFDPAEASKMAHIYIFDILEADGRSTKTKTLKERKEILSEYKDTDHIHFVTTSGFLTKPSLAYVVTLEMAADVEKAFKNLLHFSHEGGPFPKHIAEGVMIKKLDEPYSGKTWVKYKEKFEIDCLVVDKKAIVREGKKTDVFTYSLAVGPLSEKWAYEIEQSRKDAVVEYKNERYAYIGKSDNSKQNVAIGSILRIAAEDINRYETENPNYPYFKAYVSVVMQPVPERNTPDKMMVLQRLSELTPKRERLAKDIGSDVGVSVEAGKIPVELYRQYAKDGEPLPKEFYTDYREGDAWAQCHIRGIEPEDWEKYKQKKVSLAEILVGHSIHIDLRMDLGKEKLIQWVVLDDNIASYLRFLTGELRETAGGVMNVQHSLAIVKPSAEEPQKLEKAENDKELTISSAGAKQLVDIIIEKRSYFIPPGQVGATREKPAYMGLIWSGKVKAGCQRKDFHEYFLYPDKLMPEQNRSFFDGRFIMKCLKRESGSARWEIWKASKDSKPIDSVEHKDSGFYFPVKADQIKSFGRENYEYVRRDPK